MLKEKSILTKLISLPIIGAATPKTPERFSLAILKDGKNMRVYLAGQNLVVWTDYPGYDPEVRTYTKNPQKRGVDFGTYPGTRSLLLGLKLNY